MKVWKYYIDSTKSDTIFIEIKANYSNSKVFYNKEHIGTIVEKAKLKKGVLFDCSDGVVSVKSRKKPPRSNVE